MKLSQQTSPVGTTDYSAGACPCVYELLYICPCKGRIIHCDVELCAPYRGKCMGKLDRQGQAPIL